MAKLTTRRLAYLALITAACVVGRMSFTFIPNVQPMTALLLIMTQLFTLPEACLIAGLSLIITNLYLGFGIWTLGQLISYLMILTIFYLLTKLPIIGKNLLFQSLAAGAMGFVYGFTYAIFNYFLIGLTSFWPYWISGLSFDALHAVGNIGFYLLLAPVMERIMKRH